MIEACAALGLVMTPGEPVGRVRKSENFPDSKIVVAKAFRIKRVSPEMIFVTPVTAGGSVKVLPVV